MTIWLLKRLAIWVSVSFLGGALVGDVEAQAQSGVKASPQEVSRQFIAGLIRLKSIRRRYEAAAIFDFRHPGPISQKSIDELQTDLAFEKLSWELVKDVNPLDFKVQLATQNRTDARVGIEQKAKPKRQVVLLRENGAWKVDLIETFAKWNKLSRATEAEAIYKLTGVLLEGLPHDEKTSRSRCQTNMQEIALAILAYAQDHDERLPQSKVWVDALQPYLNKGVFKCPDIPKNQKYGYAFNLNFSNKYQLPFDLPNDAVLIYETSIFKRNAYGRGENLAFRHQNGANFAFADGHVKWLLRDKTPSFGLKPFKTHG